MSTGREPDSVFIVTQKYGRDESKVIGVFRNWSDAGNSASTAHMAYHGNGEPIRSTKENGLRHAAFADAKGYPFIWINEHVITA